MLFAPVAAVAVAFLALLRTGFIGSKMYEIT